MSSFSLTINQCLAQETSTLRAHSPHHVFSQWSKSATRGYKSHEWDEDVSRGSTQTRGYNPRPGPMRKSRLWMNVTRTRAGPLRTMPWAVRRQTPPGTLRETLLQRRMPRCGDWGELHRLLNSRKGSLNATHKKNTDANDKPMISFRKLYRHWTPWRRNTLTSRPPWQMSQASTRQEMYYTQRTWKWLQSSNKPRKIKAVNRTIWTARARHWPRQQKNFQTSGQHTRPRALNFAAPSGMFATDVQLMKSFASKQRKALHRTFEINIQEGVATHRERTRRITNEHATSTMALALWVEPCKPQPKPRTP